MVRVELEKVTKLFDDVTAVDEVTLTIESGELFFLLGPSGCGKTTLLRMIAGFYLPDSGTIRFDERDMTNVPPHKRNTGMVFQNYALWPHMSVEENVVYGLEVRDTSADERRERVNIALKTVQMEELAERRPNQLSGGQQQRVALARALVIEPDAVLLDEPLSNLDAKLRLEMREEIRRIHDSIGVTMIYVTHDQAEALSMADRLAVLQDGIVRQVGPPRGVYTHPSSTFVAGFIGETNFIPGLASRGDVNTQVETAFGMLSADNSDTNHLGEVTCSIRPEAIRVMTEGDPLSGGSLVGNVESVMYLGDTEQYLVRLANDSRVRCVEFNPARPKARVGDDVTLTFEGSDVIVLPND
jgi:iron(III) transport system ATP-binding protein